MNSPAIIRDFLQPTLTKNGRKIERKKLLDVAARNRKYLLRRYPRERPHIELIYKRLFQVVQSQSQREIFKIKRLLRQVLGGLIDPGDTGHPALVKIVKTRKVMKYDYLLGVLADAAVLNQIKELEPAIRKVIETDERTCIGGLFLLPTAQKPIPLSLDEILTFPQDQEGIPRLSSETQTTTVNDITVPKQPPEKVPLLFSDDISTNQLEDDPNFFGYILVGTTTKELRIQVHYQYQEQK